MPAGSVDLYAEAFLAQCRSMDPGGTTIATAGLHGVLGADEHPRVQLLVTDDRAYDPLAVVLPAAQAGMIRVLRPAQRCAQLVADRLGWSSNTATAMVSGDLSTVPAPSLPDDLTLLPVRRLADDPTGVALADAVAAAMSATTAITGPPVAFADYLRSLPPAFRLLAALDGEGRVRATSGYGVFGSYGTVMFVNTDPGWRGRGIGLAMTAHALHAARDAGVRHVSLDASKVGRSIYLRLGFDRAGALIRFSRRS
ncbi:MAG: GNAT family N-acetyltransferase [Solirubrobacterales bacterium]|nr:GNAT family N-acetyltransferase [Solirubrobacterales bacterium]